MSLARCVAASAVPLSLLPPPRRLQSVARTCPCTSPHTVTGALTGWTFDSSMRISRTMSQSCFSSLRTGGRGGRRKRGENAAACERSGRGGQRATSGAGTCSAPWTAPHAAVLHSLLHAVLSLLSLLSHSSPLCEMLTPAHLLNPRIHIGGRGSHRARGEGGDRRRLRR